MFFQISRSMQMFHSIFRIVLFIQIGQSVIVLTITIVSAILAELSLSILITKMCYFAFILSEIGVFCYLGNEVQSEVISVILKTIFEVYNVHCVFVLVGSIINESIFREFS